MHELVSKLAGGRMSVRFHLASKGQTKSRRELQNGGPSAGPNF